MHLLRGIVVTLALVAAVPAATISLSNPLTVAGTPGSTVGWGYSINNDTSSFLLITSVTPSGFGAAFGTFSDYIAAVNGVIVAPNSVAAEAFSLALQQGFGEFAISAGATPGTSTAGTFSVSYDLLVNDPLSGGSPDQGDLYGLTFVALEAGVSVDRVATVPEPATLALAGSALLAMAGLRRLSSRR